jgi:DNA-binding beta-propeller fold protein YncE
MASTRFMRRRTPRAYGLALALIALLGCDSDDTSDDAPPNQQQEDEEDGSKLPEAPAPRMHIAANDDRVRAPMDATPSPDAARVYYTALSVEGGEDQPGVFTTDAAGGSDIATLAVGGELSAPVGITVSLDGETLYVADTAAGEASSGKTGALVRLSTTDGTMALVPGTEGYEPRGNVIADIRGREQLYFTGKDPATGQGGVFRIAPEGGAVESLAPEVAMGDPGGVAVADNGDVYVVDVLSGEGDATLIRVRDGEATVVLRGIGVGFPAGTAINREGSTLLVSGRDPRTRRDVVYVLDTASGDVSVVSEPLAEFSEPAGLHRAHGSNTFAWADSEANDTGTVYVLDLD